MLPEAPTERPLAKTCHARSPETWSWGSTAAASWPGSKWQRSQKLGVGVAIARHVAAGCQPDSSMSGAAHRMSSPCSQTHCCGAMLSADCAASELGIAKKGIESAATSKPAIGIWRKGSAGMWRGYDGAFRHGKEFFELMRCLTNSRSGIREEFEAGWLEYNPLHALLGIGGDLRLAGD